jgi:hypothetical protein
VFADAAARARQMDPRRVFSIAPCVRAVAIASVVWIVVAARGPLTMGGRVPLFVRTVSPVVSSSAPGGMRVMMTIRPPSYTGLPETTAVDPAELRAIEGSTLNTSIESTAAALTVEQDGASRTLARGADGRFSDRVSLSKTGYLLVTAGATDARRLIPIVVTPDALPAVTLTAPGRDLRYAGGNPTIAFDARLRPDVAGAPIHESVRLG